MNSNAVCQTFTFGDVQCDDQYHNPCYGSHHKSNLRPIKINESTARIKFTVPRQSVFSRPYETGWTLLIARAGTNKQTAAYPIEKYDGQTEQAVFFVDDTLRRSPKGYYTATVMRGCCKVATTLLYISCDAATAINTEEFTHDPAPACAAGEVPREAQDCEKPCPTVAPIHNPCEIERCHAS